MTHDTDANKAVVQRFVRDARDRTTNQWNLDVIAEVFDVDHYFSHTWGAGLAETGRRMAEFYSGLETLEVLSEDFVAEADFVVRRATTRVRHVAELFGVAPTNREITLQHVEMWRLANGKIVEHWGGPGDGWTLYKQIRADE
jgi:predicted SnoaL-like aldol condensation-catalyzing enzyme